MSTPEDIYEDGKREDREEKRRQRLEEMGRRGGPDAPEPCEHCDGTGIFACADKVLKCTNLCCRDVECSRCLGTGVQP